MGRVTMRYNFSSKTKRQARERSGGFCEAEGAVYGLEPGQRCNAPLAGKRVEIDHYPIPATDEGSDVLENAVTCCVKCHSHKTATYDIPMQAKGKRIALRHEGIRPASKLRSAPFPKATTKYSPAQGRMRTIGSE
jgi:5-methylcytosine-specific restriction protein A